MTATRTALRNVNLRMSAILLVVAVPQRLRPLALKALLNHAIGNDVTAGYVIVRTEDLQRVGPDGLRQVDRAVRDHGPSRTKRETDQVKLRRPY